MKKNHTHIVSFTLNDKQFAKFQELLETSKTTKSQMLRLMIETAKPFEIVEKK